MRLATGSPAKNHNNEAKTDIALNLANFDRVILCDRRVLNHHVTAIHVERASDEVRAVLRSEQNVGGHDLFDLAEPADR
jgi:hypothetical protein